ncbi:MAG: thioredoxin family protein [Acidobacteriota bacterium]
MKAQSLLSFSLWIGLLAAGPLSADVIYLKNGDIIVAEKVWEEGESVKYQTSSGIQTVARTSVKRLQVQKPTAADPSHGHTSKVEVVRGAAPSTTPGPANSSTSTAKPAKGQGRSLKFQHASGYQEALRQQKSSGKPMALYFYTDWCGYCARLERNVLSQPEVQQYLNEKTLYVSVNPEHGEDEDELFANFGGIGFPTFLILVPGQRPRGIRTAVPPEAFIESCKRAAQTAE